MIKHACTLLLCTLLSALPARAQQKPAPVVSYAGEPMVIEHVKTIYRYNPDGTGEKTVSAVMRIQSEAMARQYGVLNLSYAAGNEQIEMNYLRVRKADGTVVETPPADAQDMPAEVTRLAPFYSDLRQKQYPVRSLGVGDTLEYEGVVHLTKAQAVDAAGEAEFWGAETLTTPAVALDEVVELHVPRARAVIVQSPKHKPEVADEGAERVYRWHGSQLKPTVPPPDAAKNSKDAKSEGATGDANDGLPEIAWTSFKDWAAVGAWYRSLAADRAAATPELQARAAALTAGATTDEEKIRRIYAYVSGNIRYIGVAFGIGRYQPHLAAEVLANQYGDCKDKHTLLAALLAAAGFDASPVLIGEGIKFDADLPAPSSFNHVITAVSVSVNDPASLQSGAAGSGPASHEAATGKRVWLDSTAEVAPYGMLSAPLRDKQALLVPSTGAAVLVKTPATIPFPAFDRWEAHGTLDKDGKLTGHFDVTARGDLELLLRWSLHQVTAAQWQQLGQGLSSNFGFSGTVSNFVPGSAEQTDAPLHYAYDYERDTYGDWPTHRILSLIPYGLFASTQLDKQPSDPIAMGNPRVESAKSVIHLPEGFTAKLPDAVHIQSSFASYDVTYAAKEGDVICETRLEVRESSLPAAKWEEYNSFAKRIEDNSGVYVQLRGPGDAAEAEAAGSETGAAGSETGAASSKPEAAGTVTNVEAEALVNEAWKLLGTPDFASAEVKLDQARKLNPDQRGLWATAGMLAGRQKHEDEAEADFKKEIALHPDNDFALNTLAQLQTYRKQRPQAIETLQQLLKIKANDSGVTLQLASLLTAEKRYPEALTLLQAAALKNSGNKQLILQLGRTQLAAGRNEEAVATFHTALEDTTDPLVLNDAAYELASHHADLQLAETSARKALASLDAQTQKDTLAEVTPAALGHTALLSATWDTLGWIEFEKGDAAGAQPLLAAAWATSQHPEVGYHLGQAYEKLGKPQEAYEAYRHAQAAMNAGISFVGSDDLPVRMLTLEKSGVHARLGIDAKGGLGEERTYTLPLLSRQQVSGDYWLLLSPGKVEGASFIEGAPELKALEPKLVSALQPALGGSGKPTLFPGGSGARLVRRGILSCSPLLHSCILALMLPQDVRLQPRAAADVEKGSSESAAAK